MNAQRRRGAFQSDSTVSPSSAVLQPTENGVSESSSLDIVSWDGEKNMAGREGRRERKRTRESGDKREKRRKI